jgi:NAD(P)-dependent dehydrogenase (short-subunit alcohol dehydrogenase family)
VKTILIITNFCNAYKKKYFDKFKRVLQNLPPNEELSILVNNIGHRTAWNPYHEMPEQKINDTIVCGTIVQSRLTQLAIQHFIKRKKKSAIINITAMCQTNNFWFGTTNEITVPYMSVYEGSNAFGFYHSNSIQSEYNDIIDVLNITPGAVITEKTQYLKNQPFSVPCSVFVKNIIRLLGNYTGPQYAYWGHEISSIMVNFMTKYCKDKILLGVGKTISENYMSNYVFS